MKDNLLLANQLCFALYSATNAITRLYARKLEGVGLTYSQYLAMLVLWENDGITVGEIGQRLYLDSGTLTPLLKRLEKSGWVIRKRDQDDERIVRVALTKAGKAIEKNVSKLQKTVACQTELNDKDFTDLKNTLNALTETMHAHVEKEMKAA